MKVQAAKMKEYVTLSRQRQSQIQEGYDPACSILSVSPRIS